jgi:hypothetical protein
VATPDDAQEVCSAIRSRIGEAWSSESADSVRILYGGSVKAANVTGIMERPMSTVRWSVARASRRTSSARSAATTTCRPCRSLPRDRKPGIRGYRLLHHAPDRQRADDHVGAAAQGKGGGLSDMFGGGVSTGLGGSSTAEAQPRPHHGRRGRGVFLCVVALGLLLKHRLSDQAIYYGGHRD